ncbi:class III extradiol ring-cleavage dioxygenase [Chelatococcus sp. SYSU_G07232]|uniref:Class III extradiol ring-cleavage dioxygenase n=1 Tax=Chelatococcus albus TaxID=3047466 RepID=A0ABT7AKF1_9HYPH|nr:class III extradiol ring-cleavage dioxygenase [Chelatococcus sp. SYSU_G07232]MDJ1159839.1 class III extradiol ring-cleavage dioxygenase [Chelatococcus sp. SYSU_G07232]
MSALPTLFVSHGAPNLVLHNTAARRFLAAFGRTLPRPRAILVATAHFAAPQPLLTADEWPGTIHDFGGFEPELYRMTYDAPGDPSLAVRAAGLLQDAGFAAAAVRGRGYDHGTWVPLALLYPQADIPVVQLSVQPDLGPAHHLKLGAALAPLREEGVLIVGSGAITHNLHEFFGKGYPLDAPAPDWVKDFGEWVKDSVQAGATDDLLAYRERAPHGAENHPTEEHFLPLFVAMGAAGQGAHGERVHTSEQYGVLMMDAYRFN